MDGSMFDIVVYVVMRDWSIYCLIGAGIIDILMFWWDVMGEIERCLWFICCLAILLGFLCCFVGILLIILCLSCWFVPF